VGLVTCNVCWLFVTCNVCWLFFTKGHFLTPLTNRIHSILHSTRLDSNDNITVPPGQNIIQLTEDQFNTLLKQGSSPILPTGPSLPPTPALSTEHTANVIPPSYYNNAKYEDIVCKAIKPSYDGSKDNLIPFLYSSQH
jgi:hypothetical protein